MVVLLGAMVGGRGESVGMLMHVLRIEKSKIGDGLESDGHGVVMR